MWKPGEMETPTRPNPYSSSTIDVCGKRGFGTLFSDFLRFFRNFLIAQGVPVHIVRPERQRKSICSHSEMASKGLQMPNAMELVGYRKRKYDAENPGVEDGGARRRRRERGTVSLRAGSGGKKRTAAGQECLSLARRYNTLDLAGKVSVPRGCGPFGNPGEEGRRRLCDRNGIVPVRGSDGAIQPVAACRGIAEIRLGRGATGARHFLRKWYYPL